jgi:hypothetical protein
VACTLGLILVAASLAKYDSVTDLAMSAEGLDQDWWLVLSGLGIEAVLGLWLVAGVFPFTARRLAMVCFGAFAVLSLLKGLRGEPSCGCLGAVQLSPWFALTFDIAALALLAAVRPAPAAVCSPLGIDLLALCGIVAFGVGLGVHAYESVTSLSRGLVLSEQRHEIGVVGQSESLTHVFTVENRCRYAVEIAQSSSTCRCTTLPDLNGQVLAPGEKLEIPITLHTGDSDEHIVGGVNLYCRKAGSTAPPTLHRRIQLSARVDPDYWVRPLMTDFGRALGQQTVTRQVRVRPNRKQDLQLMEFKSSHPAFGASVRKDRNADGDLVIDITFDGRKMTRSEPVGAVITVTTSSPHRPEFRLLARVAYESPLSVSPSAIVVGSDIQGVVTREIAVRATSRVDVTTTGSPSSGLEVSAVPSGPDGTEWRIVVRVPATALNDTVKFVVTGLGDPLVVTVPVHRFTTDREGKP